MTQQFQINLFDKQYFTTTNNNTVKRIEVNNSTWRSCFGNNIFEINPNNNNNNIKLITWKIKINKTQQKNFMIGICGEPWDINRLTYANKNGYMYCYDGSKRNSSNGTQYGKSITGDNSEIIMQLNMINRTLSFKIDNVDCGIAFDNLPNNKYRFAIDMYNYNDEITILNETIEYNNNEKKRNVEIENKENENEELNEMKEIENKLIENEKRIATHEKFSSFERKYSCNQVDSKFC